MNREKDEMWETEEREWVRAAVVGTNARVSPEQFQALQKALGQEVTLNFHVHAYYSDEEESSDYDSRKKIVLKDVGFF